MGLLPTLRLAVAPSRRLQRGEQGSADLLFRSAAFDRRRSGWRVGLTVSVLLANSSSPDNSPLKTTRYFEEQVLRKRPYIRREWCEQAVAKPLRWETQPDGRIRHWVAIPELGGRFLRVVTLADGETILNAFLDRNVKL